VTPISVAGLGGTILSKQARDALDKIDLQCILYLNGRLPNPTLTLAGDGTNPTQEASQSMEEKDDES
jgi:hypothetical protein